jgi:hypothetical protein
MHGKPKRRRACRGKVRYRDQKRAEYALRILQGNSNLDRLPKRSYYCADCNGFHLTSRDERLSRAYIANSHNDQKEPLA